MHCNVAHFQSPSSGDARLALAEPLAHIALSDVLVKVGVPATVALGRVLLGRGRKIRKQYEFWDGILTPQELNSYLVVCGGRNVDFADQVRGNIHAKGRDALADLIRNPILDLLHSFTSSGVDIFSNFGHKAFRAASQLNTFARSIDIPGVKSRFSFPKRLRRADAKLLIPFAGHVTNGVVEQQLFETQGLRKYRIVSTSEQDPTPQELTTRQQLHDIREFKKHLIDRKGSAEESSVLDPAIRYEIWEKNQPIARAHSESMNGRAVDFVYLLFTRRPRMSSGDEAVLSMQSLHPLALAGTKLFHFPYETLGDAASDFREHALAAVRRPGSIGFEAILKVSRNSARLPLETPRAFGGIPSLSNASVSVLRRPTAVEP